MRLLILILLMSSGLLFADLSEAETVMLSPRQVGPHVLESWTGERGLEVVARFEPTALPFRDTHAAVDGDASSVSHYELTSDGFEIAVDHVPSPGDAASAQSRGALAFRVNRRVRYEIRGHYEVSGLDRLSARFDVSLVNTASSPAFLLEAQQWSDEAANPVLRVGPRPGPEDSQSQGSWVGDLEPAGHYRLLYRFQLVSRGAGPEAVAGGHLSLRFFPYEACRDDVDNDDDGHTDYPADADCAARTAASESLAVGRSVSLGPPRSCGLGVEIPGLLGAVAGVLRLRRRSRPPRAQAKNCH